jgi:hypothetical protein
VFPLGGGRRAGGVVPIPALVTALPNHFRYGAVVILGPPPAERADPARHRPIDPI